ncbi:exported hypothetical protein [uncultured delta proteobacterium]|uniref:DUF5610 domain-containing protein n=1 Tax=uncultured delta proteobacterium TaxID=34034 RepID=A0A212IUZ3_9DELT|nr:exported hypothetical protein [uncultured delta proteobacterium]
MSLAAFSINTGGMAARMGAIGSSFAYDLTRRVSQSQGLDSAQASRASAVTPTDALADEQAAARAEKTGQLQKLESALSGTVAYMADKHGEKAASAMIALVYKRLGDGEINEESLGNAFLDVTRFIDANFGTGAGDNFMAHLNGSLNDSMNAFFDNGLSETFMVAPVSSGEGGAGGSVDAASLLEDIAQQYTDAIKEMLEEMRANPEQSGVAAAYGDPAHKEPMIGVMKDIVV